MAASDVLNVANATCRPFLDTWGHEAKIHWRLSGYGAFADVVATAVLQGLGSPLWAIESPLEAYLHDIRLVHRLAIANEQPSVQAAGTWRRGPAFLASHKVAWVQ